MTTSRVANPIEAIVDKINSLGDKVHETIGDVPGFGMAAEIGKMSLSANKWVRAAQILSTAVGGMPVIGVVVLLKKALGGSDEAQEDLMEMLEMTQTRLTQDMAKSAGTLPCIKNPVLRARLIAAAIKVRDAKRMELIAKGLMKLPERMSPGDVIEWKPGMPMKILRVNRGGHMDVELDGKRVNFVLPNKHYSVLRSDPPKKNWLQRGMGAAKTAGDDLALIPADDEEEEYTDEESEASVVEEALEFAGNQVAPRTTKNIKEMVAKLDMGLSFEEEEEEEEDDEKDDSGMDDGSYPAGPRTESNKSRYHVEPAHGQSLVDVLQTTASFDSILTRIDLVANG